MDRLVVHGLQSWGDPRPQEGSGCRDQKSWVQGPSGCRDIHLNHPSIASFEALAWGRLLGGYDCALHDLAVPHQGVSCVSAQLFPGVGGILEGPELVTVACFGLQLLPRHANSHGRHRGEVTMLSEGRVLDSLGQPLRENFHQSTRDKGKLPKRPERRVDAWGADCNVQKKERGRGSLELAFLRQLPPRPPCQSTGMGFEAFY